MNKFSYKQGQALLALFSLFILACSVFFEYYRGLQPCPLCIMQRYTVMLLLMICFVGVYSISQKRSKILSILQILFSFAGLFFAGRQLWLQSLPADQTPSCLPGLNVLMQYFPWQDVVKALFWGSGDCAEVSWQWLGLSMPAWAILYFLFMFITGSFLFWRLSRAN